MSTQPLQRPHVEDQGAPPTSPMSLTVQPVACMLNFELTDDPVYDGAELQWFDDELHGTGMLAFLSRRADRRVDYYVQAGLTLDRAGYEIGGGTGTWIEIGFDRARLEVAEDGVHADVAFTDIDGRRVEILVDDRDGRPRRRAGLLAPVGADIQQPASLMLVWMPSFDLVRATGTPPAIRIDGRSVTTGRLPGTRLHRRHLIKYAAPVVAVHLNRAHDGPIGRLAGELHPTANGRHIQTISAQQAGCTAEVFFEPALPGLDALAGGTTRGHWHIVVEGQRLTGGGWSARRVGSHVALGLSVHQTWRPQRLPWLMRLVTTVLPVFRRWPTTYRWHADVQLDDPPVMTAGWERTGGEDGKGYRRSTGSSR